MEKLPITQKGFVVLEAEFKRLKTVERPAVIAQIAEARAHGDLSENAEYHAARDKQSFIEGRIQDLEDKIARAQVVDISVLEGPKVKFGATVKLADCDNDEERTYQIVGEYESNLEEGRISFVSPIARALIGKEEGDVVEVVRPSGKKSYEIIEVNYC